MAGLEILDVRPEAAIEYFRAKGVHMGFDWRDTAEAVHVRSFTVAKAARLDVLTAVRGALDRVLSEGESFQAFRERLEPELVRLGWWGQKIEVDPETGKKRVVQLGSPRRLRTIFQTNLATAAAHGQWQSIQRLKEAAPYLMYDAVLDGATRPEHQAWDGIVLPVDDPWWSTHYPPNGWNCRCSVQQLSADDLDRYGLKVHTDRPPYSSSGDTRPWRNKRTGKVHQVPRGIDPGWSHNVGKVNLERDAADAFISKIDRAPDDLARAAVGNPWGTPEFTRHLTGVSNADWPIAVLDAAVLKAISGTSRTVRLSDYTVKKQAKSRKGQNFTADDYARVQRIIDQGEVFLSREHFAIGFIEEDGKFWRAVVKSTQDGSEAYLMTLHRARDYDIRVARRELQKIR